MKRFTIGITTHNESASINGLLSALSKLGPDEADIILYDDCSDDDTRAIVEVHPIAQQPNFHAHFADFNNGTPSVGRAYIGQNARTEYTILVDGDDVLDIIPLRKAMAATPSGYDFIFTPYALPHTVKKLNLPKGKIDVSNETINRVLSGIGGKIYRSSLLAEYGPDPVKGRSDDVRLNMRIIAAIRPKILYLPDFVFYRIPASRKSMRLTTINFDEVRARVENYIALQSIYPIDRRYLLSLKRNFVSIMDTTPLSQEERQDRIDHLHEIFHFNLRRIIFLVEDFSTIGGISGRVRRVVRASKGRDVEYACIAARNANEMQLPDFYSYKDDPEKVLSLLSEWSESNTVLLTANNVIREFPKSFARAVRKHALIHMNSGQMAFYIQDTFAIADAEYVSNYRASAIVSLSDADIAFQRQLGIHGQTKGFLPVATRSENSYDPTRNKHLGFVGRIDFHAKDCGRLINVGRAIKAAGLPPVLIFTTTGGNAPDYAKFRDMIATEGLEDSFQFTIDCTDHDLIYREISMLLLPSRKEAFGNVILEAYSHGIPVIGATYAPGPSELIENERTGYLLDDFSGKAVIDLVTQADEACLQRMSRAAFEKHKKYSMESHLEFLEKVATDVLNIFTGKNELPVFPDLKLTRLFSKGEKPVTKPDIRIPKPTPKPAPVAITPAMTRKDYAEKRLAPLTTEIAKLERKRERQRERES